MVNNYKSINYTFLLLYSIFSFSALNIPGKSVLSQI